MTKYARRFRGLGRWNITTAVARTALRLSTGSQTGKASMHIIKHDRNPPPWPRDSRRSIPM